MKYYIIQLIRKLLKMFYIFPLKNNRIMFTSYGGKQYSCNPKYIYQYLMDTQQELELIWAFNTPDEFDLDAKTIKVRYKSLRYLYLALTSKIIVENFESWSVLPIRDGQTIINTWHGGGAYKKVGVDRKDAQTYNLKNVEYKNHRVNIFVSSSKAFSEMTLRGSFRFSGDIIPSGMPRNDILINDDIDKKEKIKRDLGISYEKIVIIAPTFRTKSVNDAINLNFDQLVKILTRRFGGHWIVLYRSHYYENIKVKEAETNVIDVSNYPDMQELLLVSDVLITDYSSSMWDFSLRLKPVFLYSTDLKDYIENEREFYTPVNSWPFPYSSFFQELVDTIRKFDNEKYIKNVIKHHQELGSYESGNASKEVGEIILSKINKIDG